MTTTSNHRKKKTRRATFVPRSLVASASMGVGIGLGVIPTATSLTACSNSQPAIGIEPCICDFDASTGSDASDASATDASEAGTEAALPDAAGVDR
jgi:hypothetical protein